jgi:hypothetical protein
MSGVPSFFKGTETFVYDVVFVVLETTSHNSRFENALFSAKGENRNEAQSAWKLTWKMENAGTNVKTRGRNSEKWERGNGKKRKLWQKLKIDGYCGFSSNSAEFCHSLSLLSRISDVTCLSTERSNGERREWCGVRKDMKCDGWARGRFACVMSGNERRKNRKRLRRFQLLNYRNYKSVPFASHTVAGLVAHVWSSIGFQMNSIRSCWGRRCPRGCWDNRY